MFYPFIVTFNGMEQVVLNKTKKKKKILSENL